MTYLMIPYLFERVPTVVEAVIDPSPLLGAGAGRGPPEIGAEASESFEEERAPLFSREHLILAAI